MKDFRDYIKQEEIFKKLFEYYQVDPTELERQEFLFNLIKEIDVQTEIERSRNSDYDLFGVIYESFLKKEERKGLGQYYTPNSVVNYILDAVGYRINHEIEDKKLIDLSCGVGNFVIQAIRILVSRYIKLFNHKEIGNSGVVTS
jgi:type I restriction-modification system DNA methylase subunit